MNENDLTVEERIEIAANSVDFTEHERKVFMEFCKIWNRKDNEMFYGGYGKEWARRFKSKSMYNAADMFVTTYIDEAFKNVENE